MKSIKYKLDFIVMWMLLGASITETFTNGINFISVTMIIIATIVSQSRDIKIKLDEIKDK